MVVAVDVVDGAGKTVFADELGLELDGRGRQVVRACQPWIRANMVVDNNDLAAPFVAGSTRQTMLSHMNVPPQRG